MSEDAKQIIKHLTEQLWALQFRDYLVSEDFPRFCREYDLVDAWGGTLDLSRNIPNLYGGMEMKNAFVLLLLHIYRSRQKEFPALFTRLLTDFSHGISYPLPLDDMKKDLVLLGYSAHEIEQELSGMNNN
jgi:hypothetical protein